MLVERVDMILGPRYGSPDVTVGLRTREDEDRVGHAVRRIAEHLRAHKLSAEIVVADESSGDNTVAIATLLKRTFREVEVLHCASGTGFLEGCERARGRAIILYDARSDAPLALLSYALRRMEAGTDVISVGGRYLVMRRTRAWRAFEALQNDPTGGTLVRRAKALGLSCLVTHETRPRRLISGATAKMGRSLRQLGSALRTIAIASF